MLFLGKRVLPLALLVLFLLSEPVFCQWPNTGNKQLDQLLEDAKNAGMSRALPLYQKALTISPNCADIYAERAMHFEAAGEYDKALADCEKAITLQPNDPVTYLTKARVYLLTGKYKQAISAAYKAGSSEHSFRSLNGDDLRVIGASLYHLGQYKEAIVPLTSGLQYGISSKQSADALYFRGLCYDNLGELDKAMADIESAIKVAPCRPQYYSARAKVFRKSGKIDLAIADERRSKNMKEERHRLFY